MGHGLPYANSIRGRQSKPGVRLDIECGVPRVEIAHGIGSVLIGRVAISDDLLAQRRLARLRAPTLRVADEELLVAGEPLEDRCRLGAARQGINLVRDRK